MKRTFVVILTLGLSLMVVDPALAQSPPGWDKGTKAGWDGDCPPGWDKKTPDEKKQLSADYEKARLELVARIQATKEPTLDVEIACDLFRRGVNSGLEIGVALELTRASVDLRVSKDDCEAALKATATCQGTEVPQVEMGAFVVAQLKAGHRGNALTLVIKDEIGKRDKKIKESRGNAGNKGKDDADQGNKGSKGGKGGKGGKGK